MFYKKVKGPARYTRRTLLLLMSTAGALLSGPLRHVALCYPLRGGQDLQCFIAFDVSVSGNDSCFTGTLALIPAPGRP